MSKELNGKKKATDTVGYIKWTEITNKKQLIDVINKSNAIYMLKQVVYNDKSQSMTVEIHFK